MKNRIQYRRVREGCRDCHQPIEREPTTDGNLYGWTPQSNACYYCHVIDLFGGCMQPSEAWWRKVRRLLRAAEGVAALNERNTPDVEF